MSIRKTREEWQLESNAKYNNEFDILDIPKSGQQNVSILHKKCGNILSMKLNNHLKRYCAFCNNKNKKTKQDWQRLSDEIHGGQFVIIDDVKSSKSKVTLLHKPCNQAVSMTMNNHINHKNGCKKCAKNSLKNNEYWVSKCLEVWGNEYQLLDEVDNVWNKIRVIHNLCGSILEKDMSNLIHNKRGCNICSKKNYGEEFVEKYLISNSIIYERQKTFDNLRNPVTNRKLFVDFWINDEFVIEVDGIQHRRPISHWGGEKDFKSQLHRDNIKNKFFSDRKILLVRITSQEVFNIQEIINNIYDGNNNYKNKG